MDLVGFRGAPGPGPRNDQEVTVILSSGLSFTFKSLTWYGLFSSIPPAHNMHIGGVPLSGAVFEWKFGAWGLPPFAKHLVGVLDLVWLFLVLRNQPAKRPVFPFFAVPFSPEPYP